MGAVTGKIALVTGASRGIGAAIAQRLGAEGATVIATARTVSGAGRDYGDQEMAGSLRDTVAAIEASGGKAVGLQCDVADPASRARLIGQIGAQFDRVDILVNNAATATGHKPYWAITDAMYEKVWETNVRAAFDFIQRLAPGMAERGHGWIVNITSRSAELPVGPPFSIFDRTGGQTLYGATKAALNRMTAGLAAEFAGTGIAVNAMAPSSLVWTPGAAAAGLQQYRSLPEWHEEPVEAMAETAVALCTVDPETFTGHCIYSTEYLAATGRRTRTLDGRKILENWTPAID